MSRRWEAFTADVVDVQELLPLLPDPARQQAHGQLLLHDLCGLLETLQANLPPAVPKPQDIVRATDDVLSDDLTEGETYAVFAQDDLYEQVPTAALKAIDSLGVKPWMAMWEVREGSENER